MSEQDQPVDQPVEQGDIYVANESFVTVIDGERITVKKGKTRVRAGHPLLAGGRAKLFKPADVHFDVETARQEPVVPAPPAAPPAPAKKAAAAPAKKAAAAPDKGSTADGDKGGQG